jgi:hypothetical protein
MANYNIYCCSLIIAAVIAAVIGIWCRQTNQANLSFWEKLPRNRTAGTILGFLALLWCVPHATPIVWDWMQGWLYPLVFICAVLGCFFLDYLFSRALGGIFILSAIYFLHESFTFHTPAAWILALISWTIGIAGLFLSAKPHLLRDFIRLIARNRLWRTVSSVFFMFFAGYSMIVGILHLTWG